MLFLCVVCILCLRVRACNCYTSFPLRMLCMSAISRMFVKIMLTVVYISGYGGLSKSGLCVFRELCPFSFLVVSEYPSVLL